LKLNLPDKIEKHSIGQVFIFFLLLFVKKYVIILKKYIYPLEVFL